ncbi:hypothetical protein E2C01_094873 [Portunus trituberculatus]|uniref:Reverse transcriptase domain-containing protein n=1 Tax=Portunus trituberculatus TaxID=210409 RepID=A0A5B7JXB2_PORTR|nr:hypothetical protein [Portunus trituberculatus]
MLLQGVLEEYSGPVFLSRPFLVPQRDRQDPRQVVDLSALNAHIECHHFRMMMLKQVRESLLLHSWLTSLDLANAYWHVPIVSSRAHSRSAMAQQVVGYSDFYHPPVQGQSEEGPAVGQEGLLVHHLHPPHVDEAHGLLDVCSPGDTAGVSVVQEALVGRLLTECFRGRPHTVCAWFHHTFTSCCVSGCLRAFWRLQFLGGCERRSSKSTQTLRTAVGASRHLTVDRARDAGSRPTRRGTST